MLVLSTDLVVHKLPTDPAFPSVKQKLRKFKTNISVKIKEEVTNQFVAKVILVTQYPTWLANIVHVPKKDDKTRVRNQHAYYNIVEEELDGEPWFHDIKEYIRMGVYPVQATSDQKRTIRWLASGFFFSGGVLYKRTLDLGLLRCIDARQATTIMTEVHSGVCGQHISGYVLTKKILWAGYYWLTIE
ncbi:uncharacterized protein [Nicotiana sylvestris]|uniref:uncharacterized protein n=1 Tax=Nicotiana sylvestris TaxID=4096 RepID=UPI00388C6F24